MVDSALTGPVPTVRLGDSAGRAFSFDNELVVFNPLSWEVHLLNSAAAAIYEMLAEAPRTLDEIESLLAELLVEAECGAARDHAERVVSDLATLALVITE